MKPNSSIHAMIKSTLIGLCLLTCTRAFAEAELKGTPADLAQYLVTVPKTVTIDGEAEMKVPADKAILSLKVATEHKSLHDALRANQELRAKLLAFLKEHGIPAERVHASRFSSTPKFGWFGDKAKSYRVENLVKVTVQDEKEFQSAASAVDAWSEVQYVGADFEHENKEALKSQAIAQACENANQRSKAYQDQLGLKLVAIRFGAGTVTQRTPANLGNYPRLVGGLSRSPAMVTALPQASDAQSGEEVSSFGELVFTAQVAVEYAVQPK
jgi:uncharacterized protein